MYGIVCGLVAGDAPQDPIPPYTLLHDSQTGPSFGLHAKGWTMSRCILFLLSPLCLGADWSRHPVNELVKQSPTHKRPAPMFGWEGSGASDPFSKKWIHFGGHDGIPQGVHLFT